MNFQFISDLERLKTLKTPQIMGGRQNLIPNERVPLVGLLSLN